jgi:hypothetical protein
MVHNYRNEWDKDKDKNKYARAVENVLVLPL